MNLNTGQALASQTAVVQAGRFRSTSPLAVVRAAGPSVASGTFLRLAARLRSPLVRGMHAPTMRSTTLASLAGRTARCAAGAPASSSR